MVEHNHVDKSTFFIKADEHITAEREINLLNREKIELTEQKRRKDGSLIWTEVVVQRIEIDGEYCALSVSRDITERKAIEEKLKHSRNRIMSILDAIPDMIFVLNHEGVFLEYSAKSGSKLYRPPESFLNQSLHKVMPGQLAALTLDKIIKTLKTGTNQIYNYELEIAGEKHYFESRMVKSTDTTVLSIVRDITETIKAGEQVLKNEEKYKAIFLNAPVGVLNFNEQGVILDCNDLFVKIIGSSREALIGFNMLQRVKNVEIKSAIQQAITFGSGYFEGNYTSVTANKITPVKGWFKSIYDEKGNFVDGIGLIEDITDQKKYEQELVAARKLAEQSDRLKSSFMATMSHELRTPLNTVIGFADMLDESMPVDQVNEFAGVISKSGKHLLNIIEDILDISLIDSGEVQLSREKNVLGDFAESLLMLAQHEKSVAGKNNLSVTLSIPAYMRKTVIFIDTNKINKVFTQIIRNAFKFTKEGSVEIGIVKKPESDTSGDILFYVKDSGIGISKDQQHYIFDVFRQVDDSSTREFEGTGLGLAISQKLVQLMKGKIWVESDLGKGSEFYVKLPCLTPASKEEELYHHPDGSSEETAFSGSSLVLVAVDDENNFHLYNQLLKRKKIAVEHATNGTEVIKRLEQKPAIDLVLVDINTSGMGRLEIIAQIKDLQPELPVIALTANSAHSDKELMLNAGCNDLLSKPINNQLFIDCVLKYLSPSPKRQA